MKKLYPLFNIFLILFMTVSAFSVDPFKENYSAYTVHTWGYCLVLFLGIACAVSHYIALKKLSYGKSAFFIAFSFVSASILPSQNDPSTALANLHLTLAYFSFALYISVMLLFLFQLPQKESRIAFPVYFFSLVIAMASYMKMLCINAFSEWIVIVTGIIILTVLYVKKT